MTFETIESKQVKDYMENMVLLTKFLRMLWE